MAQLTAAFNVVALSYGDQPLPGIHADHQGVIDQPLLLIDAARLGQSLMISTVSRPQAV